MTRLAALIVGIILIAVVVAACSSSSGDKSASCSEVKNPTLLGSIKADGAQAVRAGGDGFYVAVTGGATWFTTSAIDKDDSGLVIPLNDAARAASDVGVDVPVGAPVLKGHADGDAGAKVARSCAG